MSWFGDFHTFLTTYFDQQEMRMLAMNLPRGEEVMRELPGRVASINELAAALASTLATLDSIDTSLWTTLINARPTLSAEIAALRDKRREYDEQREAPASGQVASLYICHADLDYANARLLQEGLSARGLSARVGGEHGGLASRIQAIKSADTITVILSPRANHDAHVWCEVERSIHHNKHLLVTRTDDIDPRGTLETLLSLPLWVDAFPPPFSRHVDRLCEALLRVRCDRRRLGEAVGDEERDLDLQALARALGVDRCTTRAQLSAFADSLGLAAPLPVDLCGLAGFDWVLRRLASDGLHAELRELGSRARAERGGASRRSLSPLRSLYSAARRAQQERSLWLSVGSCAPDSSVVCELRLGGEGRRVESSLEGGNVRVTLGSWGALELSLNGKSLDVRVTGPRRTPLLGIKARLWWGARSVSRRLLPKLSDQLGADASSCVYLHTTLRYA